MSDLQIGGLLILMWVCGIWIGYMFGQASVSRPDRAGGKNV